MKSRYVRGAAALAAMLAAAWAFWRLTSRADEASLSDRVGMLPYLPREKWTGSVATLAAAIRRLPASADKRQLIRVLADRVTERGADHAVVQGIAETVAEVINDTPDYDRGPILWSLAHLAHYDHVTVSVDDPRYRAALDRLEAQDRQRENADFQLADIEGGTWRLRDLRGKVVLVIFWATWCPDCRAEMPDLQVLAERFAKPGLTILAISDEARERVAPFITSKRYTFPALLDPGGDIEKAFQVEGIPQSFLYNRAGRLVAHAVERQNRAEFLGMLKAAGLGG